MENLTPDGWSGLIISVLLFVILDFLKDRSWDWYLNKTNRKELYLKSLAKRNQLLQKIMDEIEYNKRPGVGGPQCNFEVKSHEDLLYSDFCNQALKEDIKKIITTARLCNGNASQAQPGHVKSLDDDLRRKLDTLQKE